MFSNFSFGCRRRCCQIYVNVFMLAFQKYPNNIFLRKCVFLNNNTVRSVIMKRNGRSASDEPLNKYSTRSTNKINLSQFQIGQKQKLESSSNEEVTTANINKKQASKREHVNIAYDLSCEIKKEEHDGSENCSDDVKVENSTEVSSSIKQETIEDDNHDDEPSSSIGNQVNVKSEKFAKKNIKSELYPPSNWREVLQNLRKMREGGDAPVDSMGCDRCMDEKASPKEIRYQALLSLMLSSQTKDQVTHAAMLKLHGHGCNVENILNTSDEELGKLIYPVSFWKTKVKYIKNTTKILKDEYDSDIPNTVEKLCKLPGVGPKMAHLCMKTAWGEITGIGVDTHVHRITNRLGWVNTKTPEETRKTLESWLPKELWSEVNNLLVGFGQQVCQPQRPQCATCLNYNICPYGVKHLASGSKIKKAKK